MMVIIASMENNSYYTVFTCLLGSLQLIEVIFVEDVMLEQFGIEVHILFLVIREL